MEALEVIEGQVDEARKERNTMICQIIAKDEEIFKMKSDIISLKIEADEATRIKEETENNLLRRIMSVKDLKKRLSSSEKRLKG